MINKLIDSGLALIPVPAGLKGPTSKGWNNRENVVTDTSLLNNQNIGLAHAYCTPTPTCAIDIDDYREAKAWLNERAIDLDTALKASDAVVIWSGKKYSLKLLYRLPSDVGPIESKQLAGADASMMLEFRCAAKNGTTVQDILPPSLHPSGTQYQWIGKGSPLKIPNIPQGLLDIWLQLLNNDSKKIRPTSVHQEIETPRRVARVREMLTFIDAACDRPTWRNLIWSLLSTGFDCAEDLAMEWSMSAPEAWDENQFWGVVNSYNNSIDNRHTLGTVVHFAKLGGWHG
jgi:hypothetical protein